MCRKYKSLCTNLNCIECSLILAYTSTGCISISVFAPLTGIPLGITSSVIGLKICALTAGIKKYNSIIKKKKHDKIVLLTKSELNNIEVLTSKASIDSVISHEEFVLIHNFLKEYSNMKEEIKILKT